MVADPQRLRLNDVSFVSSCRMPTASYGDSDSVETSKNVRGAWGSSLLFLWHPQFGEWTRCEMAAVGCTLGPDHPDTALAMFNIADQLHSEGRNAEAASLFRETAELQSRVLGPTHADTLDSFYMLACMLAEEHKPNEAL